MTTPDHRPTTDRKDRPMTTTDITPETSAWIRANEDYTAAALRYGRDREFDTTTFGLAVEGLVAEIAEIHRYANIGLADIADHLTAARNHFAAARASLPQNGFGIADDADETLRTFIHAAEYLLGTLPEEVRR